MTNISGFSISFSFLFVLFSFFPFPFFSSANRTKCYVAQDYSDEFKRVKEFQKVKRFNLFELPTGRYQIFSSVIDFFIHFFFSFSKYSS